MLGYKNKSHVFTWYTENVVHITTKVTSLCDVTLHLHCFLLSQLCATWLSDVQSFRLRWCGGEGGFHHGVDAGKSAIANDRIFPVSPNTPLIFLARFVSQITFVRMCVQSGGDSLAKGDEFNPLAHHSALSLLSDTTRHQQPQVKASIEPVSMWGSVLTRGGFMFSLCNLTMITDVVILLFTMDNLWLAWLIFANAS